MDYYGDVSGHFRGLLNGDCEVCVVGVVAGDRGLCRKCPSQTVRRISDVSEAKWNDLMDHQKRRLFECFADTEGLEFGYARFTREKLHTLDNYHLIYQDDSLPIDWDLALTGYAYGEILYKMGAPEERRMVFEFDHVASQKQSEQVAEHLRDFVDSGNVFIDRSENSKPIQAADCLAGGVAEDFKRDTHWLDYLDGDDVVECSVTSLIKFETALDEWANTAP